MPLRWRATGPAPRRAGGRSQAHPGVGLIAPARLALAQLAAAVPGAEPAAGERIDAAGDGSLTLAVRSPAGPATWYRLRGDALRRLRPAEDAKLALGLLAASLTEARQLAYRPALRREGGFRVASLVRVWRDASSFVVTRMQGRQPRVHASEHETFLRIGEGLRVWQDGAVKRCWPARRRRTETRPMNVARPGCAFTRPPPCCGWPSSTACARAGAKPCRR